ncbi:hypothetical protein GHT06_011286 [Daphnia sinensis]|uniref:Pmp22 peroxisomal membrane protein n=1 Tax=Daphnia sinensis TaxID=1820382 RepID=A0AAD5Q1Y5_9CRUS|nr:hypothetical protein GHT06_011286 [Daphnia sinensis]
MFTRYHKLKDLLFGRYLWATNTVSCGLLLTAGDIIQQRIELFTNSSQTNDSIDVDRIGRMGTVGLVQGLPNHLWYTWLDRILPGRTLTTVGKKIVADQLICSPISSASFFVGAGMLEGCSVLEGWEEYKSKFLLVYLTDCIVWPPSQLINFLLVPAVYRVLYVNVFTVAWNVFLSYAKHFDRLKLNEKGDLYPTSHKRKEHLDK